MRTLLAVLMLAAGSPAAASTQAVFTKLVSACTVLTTSEGRVVPLCDEPYMACERTDDGKLQCAIFPGRLIERALEEQLGVAP